jgi:hypothetical protein
MRVKNTFRKCERRSLVKYVFIQSCVILTGAFTRPCSINYMALKRLVCNSFYGSLGFLTDLKKYNTLWEILWIGLRPIRSARGLIYFRVLQFKKQNDTNRETGYLL